MNGQHIQRGIVPQFKKQDGDHSGDLGIEELEKIAAQVRHLHTHTGRTHADLPTHPMREKQCGERD